MAPRHAVSGADPAPTSFWRGAFFVAGTADGVPGGTGHGGRRCRTQARMRALHGLGRVHIRRWQGAITAGAANSSLILSLLRPLPARNDTRVTARQDVTVRGAGALKAPAGEELVEQSLRAPLITPREQPGHGPPEPSWPTRAVREALRSHGGSLTSLTARYGS